MESPGCPAYIERTNMILKYQLLIGTTNAFLGTRRVGYFYPQNNKFRVYFQLGDTAWSDLKTAKEAEEWLERKTGEWLVEANCEYKG